tara:strand:+ start:2107 stop:2511 length:405 start_codon:yes stop_codon:yes gene_type:complete
MDDLIIVLQKLSLEDMGKEAHYSELNAKLKALETENGKNYAVFERGMFVPQTSVAILPKPAVPPSGASKICDGELTVADVVIDVEAYRLSADDAELLGAADDDAEDRDGIAEMTGPADDDPADRMTGIADDPPD